MKPNANAHSQVARRQQIDANIIISQQRIRDEDLNTLNNLGLNPFGFYTNMIELNISLT